MKEGESVDKEPADVGDGMFCVDAAQKSEPRICGAKTRSGGVCQKPPVPGRSGRCRLHNGNAARGTDHANFRTGLYSKTLNRDLRAEYQRLLAHPALLSNRSDIAALRVRLGQLAARLETGESSRRWGELRDALAAYKAATGSGDESRAAAALARFGILINGAGDNEGAWSDFAELIDRVSVLVARERRALVEEKLVVSPADVRVIFASITEVVLSNVRDTEARAKIAERLDALHVLTREEIAVIGARALKADHGNDQQPGSEN